jgi:hypothetical protein
MSGIFTLKIKNQGLLSLLMAKAKNPLTGNSRLTIDSRPEFNGEFSLYLTLCALFDISRVLIVGARDDFFYIQTNSCAEYLLIEPSVQDAQRLIDYANKRAYKNIKVSTCGVWNQDNINLEIYPGGTCFPIRDENQYGEAIRQGLIVDPYFIPGRTYVLNRNDAVISLAYTLDSICQSEGFLDVPHFTKLDIEGSEIFALKGYKCSRAIPFIQYEYNTFWWNAGIPHSVIFELLPDSYQYLVTPSGLFRITKPLEQYVYANLLASRIDLGESIGFVL